MTRKTETPFKAHWERPVDPDSVRSLAQFITENCPGVLTRWVNIATNKTLPSNPNLPEDEVPNSES